MSQYVTDTHPILWHISDDPRLSAAAKTVFENTDVRIDQILIPSIVLVEGAYLVERKKITSTLLDRLFYLLDTTPENYTTIPLDISVARTLRTVDPLKVPEMPDRIILATAKHFGVALVTKDRDMASAGIVPVVW